MKKTAIAFLIFYACTCKGQHSADYIQYMFNGVLINPAYAGSQGALNITALYRNQWVGVAGAPVSKSFSAHGPLKNKKVNLGLTVENDRFAVYDLTRINGLYTYRLPLAGGHLALGLQGGVELQSSNWNRMVISDVNDPNFQSVPVHENVIVAGTGIYYNNPFFYAGVSIPQLIKNNFAGSHTLLYNAGVLLNAGEDFKIKPSVLIKHLDHSPLSANISSTFYYREIIGLGAGYTYNNGWMVFTDIRFNDQFRFGYGYERSVSKLSHYSAGSHEIMLRYLFSYKLKTVSARYF